VVRLVIFLVSEPIICPDTQSYVDLAEMISKLDLSDFDGLRTPGYPFIILLSGLNLKVVVLVQMIMGVFISYLIATTVYKFTNNTVLSLVASCLYSLFIPFLFYEMAILSETTAAFFILLSFVLFANIDNNQSRILPKMVGIIIISCFAALTRPIYFVLPLLYTVFFMFILARGKYKFPKILLYSFVSLVPLFVSIIGWSFVNWKYNDTLNIRERDKNIQDGNPHIDTIWGITDEKKPGSVTMNWQKKSKTCVRNQFLEGFWNPYPQGNKCVQADQVCKHYPKKYFDFIANPLHNSTICILHKSAKKRKQAGQP